MSFTNNSNQNIKPENLENQNNLQNQNENQNMVQKKTIQSSKLPQVVILYGPPASGKGTQADFLKKLLPDFYHLDFGTALRNFVVENLGNYFDPSVNSRIAEEIQSPEIQKFLSEKKPEKTKTQTSEENSAINSTISKGQGGSSKLDKLEADQNISPKVRAYRVWRSISHFEAVLFEDLQFVVENKLAEKIQNNQKIILEGPGRSVLEAQWLSKLFANLGLEIAIFHLYISPSETVKRSATRFYVHGVEKPFSSYKIAKENSQGSEPYRRPEDDDSDGIMSRYNRLYADIFAQIISIYQLSALAKVLTVDAHQPMEKVSSVLQEYLVKWYE